MKRAALALFLLPLAACQQAQIDVKNVWARDSVGGTASAAVYMTITSPTDDRLLGATAPVAKKTDLMTMEMGGGAMSMSYVKAIDLPAGKPVSLDPSGLHVWLADLNQPLKAGRTIPLVLKFEKAGERRVMVSIIEPSAAPPGGGK
jgi:copper(I)-binding protein